LYTGEYEAQRRRQTGRKADVTNSTNPEPPWRGVKAAEGSDRAVGPPQECDLSLGRAGQDERTENFCVSKPKRTILDDKKGHWRLPCRTKNFARRCQTDLSQRGLAVR